MSDANPQLLNFVCPKCQKKLRAPLNLAGQKLTCPKCSSPIRVPGVVESSNEDDDWLSLGEPSQPKEPIRQETAAKENASAATDLPKKDPIPVVKAVKTKPAPRPTPQSETTADAKIDPDELQLAPPEAPNSSYQSTANQSTIKSTTTAAKSVFDDDLPELAPIEEPDPQPRQDSPASTKKSTTRPVLALPDVTLPELSLDTPALISPMASLTDEEFSFPCKVCGSLLGSTRSRIGTPISCPDCYSKLVVPQVRTKKKQAEVKMDTEVASVTFAPIDSLNVRDPRGSVEKTREIMDRAEQSIVDDREEFSDGTFDTKRWMGFLFGFLRDPLVIAAAVGAGLVTGLWLLAIAAMGTWVSLVGAQALIARLALFFLFCIPIGGFICMCGIAILTMSANRASRVTEWPFAKLSESLGECAMVIVSVLIAGIPGGIIGVALSAFNSHPVVALAFGMIGIWGLTPILLLSMIDNSSILEPYSKAVWLSIKSRSEAWGAMYMQTGMAFTLFLLFMLVTGSRGPLGDFFVGLMLPLACFFLFGQYGVLAGRISEVTEMGFEGDFSDD